MSSRACTTFSPTRSRRGTEACCFAHSPCFPPPFRAPPQCIQLHKNIRNYIPQPEDMHCKTIRWSTDPFNFAGLLDGVLHQRQFSLAHNRVFFQDDWTLAIPRKIGPPRVLATSPDLWSVAEMESVLKGESVSKPPPRPPLQDTSYTSVPKYLFIIIRRGTWLWVACVWSARCVTFREPRRQLLLTKAFGLPAALLN